MRQIPVVTLLAVAMMPAIASGQSDGGASPSVASPGASQPTTNDIHCGSQDAAASTPGGNAQLDRLPLDQQLTAANVAAPEAIPAVRQANDAETKVPNFECGPFIIPAKIELFKNHDVLAAPTAAIYAGERVGGFGKNWDNWFTHEMYIIEFIGYTTNFTTTKTATGSSNSANNTGATFGLGASWQFFSTKYRFGVVVGMDYVSRSAGFQYNERPWVSASFGTAF